MAQNQQKTTEQMQRDAERRIREMQQRSNRMVTGNDMPPVPNFIRTGNRQSAVGNQQSTREATHEDLKEQPPKATPNKSTGGLLSRFKGLDILKMFNFQNIKLDSDALVIIALIFLLSTEDTDELLLLALVYIML